MPPIDELTLAAIAETLEEGLVVARCDGEITFMSILAARMSQKPSSDGVGLPFIECYHIENEKGIRFDPSLLSPRTDRAGGFNGTIFYVDGHHSAVSVRYRFSSTDKEASLALSLKDITEFRRIESETLRTRKLESITRMAGGIAHDFNNLLTSIITNLFVAKMNVDVKSETYELFHEAEVAAFQASTLAKQLISFSPSDRPIRSRLDIRDVIEESIGFVLSGTSVDYVIDIPEDTHIVEADMAQMDQVFRSVIKNAQEAMPGGGTITISAENIEVVSGETILPLNPGNYVKIRVADHGQGIHEDHLGCIFDPFFTTKKDCVGIGLSSAYAILNQHSGYIGVESEVGSGTTLYLYLPVARPLESPQPYEAEIPLTADNDDSDSGRILLMDDDPVILTSVQKLLTALRYETEVARSGEEAIALYKETIDVGRPFDLVILDLTVPEGLGGKETVARLRSIDPGVKAIVSSGYAHDEAMEDFAAYGFCGVAEKPYRIEKLHQLIKDILRGRT